jgi:hypothetical protein
MDTGNTESRKKSRRRTSGSTYRDNLGGGGVSASPFAATEQGDGKLRTC